MESNKTVLTTSLKSTAVLVTNQFQCERLIQAGRSVADISKTDLIVLNVQSNEYLAKPAGSSSICSIFLHRTAHHERHVRRGYLQNNRSVHQGSSDRLCRYCMPRQKTLFFTESGRNLLMSPSSLWTKTVLCMR